MKRLIILGSGSESRVLKQVRVSAPPPTLGSNDSTASQEHMEIPLLAAAKTAEIEQQASLEAAPVEQSYSETLAVYLRAKHDQVEHIEDRLEGLIDRQQARLQQTQISAPGLLSLPSSKRAWQSQQAQQQAYLQTLQARLDMVRDIKDGMGLHSTKLEELATRKMRAENSELASNWDSMQEATRRHELLMRKQDRKQSQGLDQGGPQTLGLPIRSI